MDRGAPGEALPAPHHHIDITGVELDTVADAAGHFGRDQARAGAEKRVIDRLAGPAVVGDRAAHAFDRLLGCLPPALLAWPVAERIVVGDLPDCRLGATALPAAGLALPYRVPAPTTCDEHGNFFNSQPCRRCLDASLADDQRALLVDQRRHGPAKFED